MKRVTREDVALRAGVSGATVSYVLNDRKDVAIPQKTRDRVNAAALQLGYLRNRVAASLVQGRTRVIGVMTNNRSGSFYFTIVRGVETTCSQRDYRVMFFFNPDNLDNAKQVQPLLEYGIDGLIVVGFTSLSLIRHWLKAASRRHIPTVIVDRRLLMKRMDCVISDDFKGGLLATGHLLSLGHRRVAHFFGDMSMHTARERRAGYCAALRKAGVPLEKSMMAGGSWTLEAARASAEYLLNLSKPPTAIFAAADQLAAAVLQVAGERGLRVPADLAVVGYGDTETSRYMGITTVSQHALEMGNVAVERLLARMEHPLLKEKEILLPTSMVVRHSCGANIN